MITPREAREIRNKSHLRIMEYEKNLRTGDYKAAESYMFEIIEDGIRYEAARWQTKLVVNVGDPWIREAIKKRYSDFVVEINGSEVTISW